MHLTKRFHRKRAFTLMELLVVIAVIGILAAILVPVLVGAKGRATRTVCLNNLKQINLGVLMYASENADLLPKQADGSTNYICYFYKEFMKRYVGLSRPSSTADKLFACPAERATPTYALPSQDAFYDYSSYTFNPRMNGSRVASIVSPVKTALVVEFPAICGFSWHRPQSSHGPVFDVNGDTHGAYNDAWNVVSFVDGHVSYLKIYNDGVSQSWAYDPPAGYDYKWSEN